MTAAILLIMGAAALQIWKPEYFNVHKRTINDKETMRQYRSQFKIDEE